MKETFIYKVTIHEPEWRDDWVYYFVGIPTQDKLIAVFEFQRDKRSIEYDQENVEIRHFDSESANRRCGTLSKLVRTCGLPNADSTARTCITSRKFDHNEITIEKLEAIQL